MIAISEQDKLFFKEGELDLLTEMGIKWISEEEWNKWVDEGKEILTIETTYFDFFGIDI